MTQINYEALINFNIGMEKYAKYAYADIKQFIHLIRQVRYRERIVKTTAVDFHPSNDLPLWEAVFTKIREAIVSQKIVPNLEA